MAKTVSEAELELFKFLKASFMFTDGAKPRGILSHKRLNNSRNEDVVIMPLAMTVGQLQKGILVVNIYVPNLEMRINGNIDKSQPNTERIYQLEKLAFIAFDSDAVFGYDYNFSLQQSQHYEDENDQYYISLRVEYTAIDTLK